MPDNHLQPVVFFQPSLEFLTYLHNYGYLNIPIRVSDSDFYDGVYIVNIDTRTDLVHCFDYSTPRALVLSAVLNRDFTVMPPNRGKVDLFQPPTAESYHSVPEDYDDSEVKEYMTTIAATPTTTATPRPCMSLQLWQVITILILILAIMVSCFAWL